MNKRCIQGGDLRDSVQAADQEKRTALQHRCDFFVYINVDFLMAWHCSFNVQRAAETHLGVVRSIDAFFHLGDGSL